MYAEHQFEYEITADTGLMLTKFISYIDFQKPCWWQSYYENQKWNGDLGVDWSIILKRIVKRWSVRP
jgi:hypothetical protein